MALPGSVVDDSLEAAALEEVRLGKEDDGGPLARAKPDTKPPRDASPQSIAQPTSVELIRDEGEGARGFLEGDHCSCFYWKHKNSGQEWQYDCSAPIDCYCCPCLCYTFMPCGCRQAYHVSLTQSADIEYDPGPQEHGDCENHRFLCENFFLTFSCCPAFFIAWILEGCGVKTFIHDQEFDKRKTDPRFRGRYPQVINGERVH